MGKRKAKKSPVEMATPTDSREEASPATVVEDPRPKSKEDSPPDVHPGGNTKPSKWGLNRILSVSSFAMSVIAVVTSFYVGYGQLVAAERAAEIARETLRLSQRAWVSIENFDYIVGEPADPHYLRFVFANTGNRPAILQSYDWDFSRGPLPDVPSYSRKEILGEMQVSPGGRLEHNISNLATVIARSIEQGAEFYFFMKLGYNDGFEDRVLCTIVELNHDRRKLEIARKPAYHCSE